MDTLDFSGLSDDQLVALAQAVCAEAISRNPAVRAAVHTVLIDEAERIRIAKSAGEAEAAAMRAAERERIARAAAAEVRAAEEARTADARRAAAAAQVASAVEAAELQQHEDMAWLRTAAALVGRPAGEISLLYLSSQYGLRVIVNAGDDRYARDHLVDYNCGTREIKTTKSLIKAKPGLIKFAIEFAAASKTGRFAAGSSYHWPEATAS